MCISPAIWSNHITNKINSTIRRNHGNNYAIIGMHSDGENGFGVKMYKKLKIYAEFHWNNFKGNEELNSKPFHHYHCGVLISDNAKLYRYYWSIRLDKLILEESVNLPTEKDSKYYWKEDEVTLKDGIRVNDYVNSEEIEWYTLP